MAYQNHKQHYHYGRCYPSNEYQVNEGKVHDPGHHNKGHVAYGTYYQEPIAEVEAYSEAREPEVETTVQRYQRARLGDRNAFESVDQEADAFIQIEHRRMELAKLMSSRDA